MPRIDGDARAAMYLFCRHLEQNGLYDRQAADEGYRYDWHSPTCREIPKVYIRSGAQTLLGDSYDERSQLLSQLRKTGCVTTEAGEVSLATGHWRRRQAEAYGYDDIYREGHYSVPSTYIPSINLVSETYQTYRSGGATQQSVIDKITTRHPPEPPVQEADRLFEAVAGQGISERTLFRLLHANDRFPAGITQLQRYVVKRAADGKIDHALAEEAVGESWSQLLTREGVGL